MRIGFRYIEVAPWHLLDPRNSRVIAHFRQHGYTVKIRASN